MTKIATPTYEEIEAKVRAALERPKKRKAQIVEWPKPLSEMELCRRQRVIDQAWEMTISERRSLNEAEEVERKLQEFVWGNRT
jgi:arginyl-tRNA--protein-N-Asp/Glu arginylyltransferase